jgi:hypothetical protein
MRGREDRPTLRRPEPVFLAIGSLAAVIGVVVAVAWGEDKTWSAVGAAIVAFAAALVAVAAVAYLWKWLGGEPLERTVSEVEASTQALNTTVRDISSGVTQALNATDGLTRAIKIVEVPMRLGYAACILEPRILRFLARGQRLLTPRNAKSTSWDGRCTRGGARRRRNRRL